MAAWFHKKGMALHPSDPDALKGLMKMGDGECVLVSIVRPRSTGWHRKYFGICKTIGEMQDPPRDAESIDLELRIRGGHYDVLIVEGHEIRVPKRIAFAKLSAEQWEALWPSLEMAICQHFGPEYLELSAA
jgi:hypothetical protein